jgi:hypothetical protein
LYVPAGQRAELTPLSCNGDESSREGQGEYGMHLPYVMIGKDERIKQMNNQTKIDNKTR